MDIRLDSEKAIEAILYISGKLKNPTFHTISKVLYFADQKHVAEYGRFIVGDEYVAMRDGPVPSAIYDMLKYVKGVKNYSPYPHIRDLFAVENEYFVKSFRRADIDEFSNSDLDCIDRSIQENGHLSYQQLIDKSHDDIYHSAQRDNGIAFESFLRLSDTPEALAEYMEN